MPAINRSITVLLADDTEFMRKAIRRLLESEPGIEVVGEVGDFAQAVKMMAMVKPRLVVMDLYLPRTSHVSPAVVRAAFASIEAQLLAISIWNDEDSKALAVEYGSAILLEKRSLVTELIPTIKRCFL